MSFDHVLKQHFERLGIDTEAIQAKLPEHLTLSLHDGVLCLADAESPNSLLYADFLSGPLSYRSQGHLGGEHLVKACRLKGSTDVRLLDATCGLGSDSFLLHQAGFQVTATEQHPVIHALLTDGQARYTAATEQPMFDLIQADAVTFMPSGEFEVIYLDPMFPAKSKSAKSKKTMRLFQALHHEQEDQAASLFQAAMNSAKTRVVIKRPTKSPLLTSHKPTFQVSGKTCRFDVYQI